MPRKIEHQGEEGFPNRSSNRDSTVFSLVRVLERRSIFGTGLLVWVETVILSRYVSVCVEVPSESLLQFDTRPLLLLLCPKPHVDQ